ncbi:glutamine amidotransferase of anthranilate synthase [Candidatus Halobonum tyrrellensis G22]|uniref:anthranilate synthase n=1 Tax=Candidatus Halobonum tyrrellensis G22 TaxID=1324957 RepID=V4HC22_9EURY|nr:glutamine amidotransferase of anthranilate synthase [Candidatus Halobonum tyrrellensis G22]
MTVVDNYDSFTYNLVEYLSAPVPAGEPTPTRATAGAAGGRGDGDAAPAEVEVSVLKNVASVDDVRATDPDAVVISPGPGHPKNDRDVGVTMPVLRDLSPDVPTLGVCLGLEAAVYEYGGSVGHAPEPVHGKAFPIDHDGRGVFDGLEQGFRAGRYHSLVATAVPDCFEVSATTDHAGEALVMGVRHREHPLEAVQFHPESVLTGVGHDVIRNFLAGV